MLPSVFLRACLSTALVALLAPLGTVSHMGNGGSQGPARRVLQDLWSRSPVAVEELDVECSPSSTCRNMRDVTFEQYGNTEAGRARAWR